MSRSRSVVSRLPELDRATPGITRSALAALIALLCLPLPGWAHSVAQGQKSNNDRVIAIQNYGGVRSAAEHVTVSYYGHMAFKLTSPRGIELFIDPWHNDPSGKYDAWFRTQLPLTRADIALVTHAHYDHDATERLDATMVLERMAGEFTLGDVRIIGIAEKHVCEPQGRFPMRKLVQTLLKEDPCPPNETTEWNNNLYVIETGGLRFLHWGDNRQNPPESVWRRIGKIDVALLAISDEGHILSHRWADEVMRRVDAKVVIPSHYFQKGITVEGQYGFESALGWTRQHAHTVLDDATIRLSPDSVKGLHHHVMYFGDHVAFPVLQIVLPDKPESPPLPEAAEAWRRFAPTN